MKSISDYFCESCINLTSIYIPDSITSISWLAFWQCNSLSDVYYNGTQEDWKNIAGNESLKKATIHYVETPTQASTATPSGVNTIIFTNNCNWDEVYLYAWNENGSNAEWPGVKLTDKTINSNNKEQYTATLDAKFTNFIFNNGGYELTVDIAYTGSETGYFLTEKKDGKWGVESWSDEPATETHETQAPTTAPETEPSDGEYLDKDGNTINLNKTFEKEESDTADFGISNSFRNLQILGVQKKNDNTKSIRFVSVVDNKVIQDAADYGYIAVGAGDKDSARSIVESDSFNYENNRNVFSCKGKNNKVSGDYGKYSTNTNYKYVTFAVNNIGDYAVAVRFYVVDQNGKVYYSPYINSEGTYNSCSTKWDDLIN
jgi:hypothetical protein